MSRFGQLFRQVRRAALAAFFFSACISMLMLVGPFLALQIFDGIIPQYNLAMLLALLALGAGAMIAVFALDGVRGAILLRAALWLDHVLGQLMFESGLKRAKPRDELDDEAAALSDLRSFLTSPSIGPVFETPFVPLFLAALFLIHPLIGEVALLAALGVMMLSVWQDGIVKNAEQMVARGNRRRQRLSHELGVDARMGRALGLADGGSSTWEIANRTAVAGAYKLGRRSSMARALARALRYSAELAIFGTGALLVMSAELSAGAMVASIVLVSRVLSPLEQLNDTLREVAAARRAIKHLQAMGQQSIMPHSAAADRQPVGRLTLERVSFAHPGRDTPILNDIDLEIAAGECLVIAGPAQSGKSTLAALIAGAAAPSSGQVSLDGVALDQWQMRSGQGPIGYLPDHALILDGTVHQNIARFREHGILSVSRAAMRVGAHEIISSLPDGYDTRTGPGGSSMSLRERRAVALARAAHDGPALMVLDTPEAGLADGEVARLARLLKDMRADGVGLIIASNEPRLHALADTVLMLERARLRTLEDAIEPPAPQAAASPNAVSLRDRLEADPALQEFAS